MVNGVGVIVRAFLFIIVSTVIGQLDDVVPDRFGSLVCFGVTV